MHTVHSGYVRSVSRLSHVFKTPKVDFKVLNDKNSHQSEPTNADPAVCQTGGYAAVNWTAVELCLGGRWSTNHNSTDNTLVSELGCKLSSVDSKVRGNSCSIDLPVAHMSVTCSWNQLQRLIYK